MGNVKLSEVDRLLKRFGLNARAGELPFGGKIATIAVAFEGCDPIMNVTIGKARASVRCPVDALHAALMIEGLRNQGALFKAAGFERMLGELFVGISRMFLESGASRLSFDSMRLHPSSYHAGRISMRYSSAPEVSRI